jgi:hypothetical protein
LLLFVLLLSACGGPADTDDTSTPASAVQASSAQTAPGATVDVPPELEDVVSALTARGFTVLECKLPGNADLGEGRRVPTFVFPQPATPAESPSARITILRVFTEAQRAGSPFTIWSFYFRDAAGKDHLEKFGVVGLAFEQEYNGVSALSDEEARKLALKTVREVADDTDIELDHLEMKTTLDGRVLEVRAHGASIESAKDFGEQVDGQLEQLDFKSGARVVRLDLRVSAPQREYGRAADFEMGVRTMTEL